ncbi:MAG: hypothetical protein ACK5XT_01890, partial [Gemmatimonas sp.]|uniref:hypothetical protein n=1 Tax=Gemmatimonas sp. TaxID=1962908 RepID=UPI00391FA657
MYSKHNPLAIPPDCPRSISARAIVGADRCPSSNENATSSSVGAAAKPTSHPSNADRDPSRCTARSTSSLLGSDTGTVAGRVDTACGGVFAVNPRKRLMAAIHLVHARKFSDDIGTLPAIGGGRTIHRGYRAIADLASATVLRVRC